MNRSILSKRVIALISLSSTLFLGGCTKLLNLGRTSKRYSDLPAFSSQPVHNYPNYSVGRFKISFLAEQVNMLLKMKEMKEKPLLVLPLKELDGSQHKVDSFGRYFAEQLKTELYLQDLRILYPGVDLEEQILIHLNFDLDKFLSSEDDPVISKLFYSGVESIVSGTYQIGIDRIYINLRIILLENTEIISVGTAELKKNEDIMSLMEKRKIVKVQENLDKKADQENEFIGFTVKGVDDF